MLLSFFHLFSGCTMITDTQVDEKSSFYYYSAGKKKIIFKYMTDTGGFFPIPTGVERYELDADPNTFEVLSNVIAKDAKNVYYRGNNLPNIDAATFEILGPELYKDKNNIYKGHCDGRTMPVWEEVDVNTFEVVGDPYSSSWSKDKDGYLYGSERLTVDKETFQIISHSTGYDKDNFYQVGKRLNADLPTVYPWNGKFERLTKYALADDSLVIMYTYNKYNVLETYRLKDRKSIHVYDASGHILEFDGNLYWENNICDIRPDKESFVGIDEKFGKDKDHVYLSGQIIPNADPSHFEVIDNFTKLSKDNKYVFYRYDILEGADPNTISFEEQENGQDLLKDKNNQWKKKYDRDTRKTTWIPMK